MLMFSDVLILIFVIVLAAFGFVAVLVCMAGFNDDDSNNNDDDNNNEDK